MESTAAASPFAVLQLPLEWLANGMEAVLMYPIVGFPLIVVWLMTTSVFFTLYLRGVNFRLFSHALDVAKGKFGQSGAGEVSPLQALFSAIAATVGLGSIAGVSVAVAIGGPGAVFWIVVAGLLGMASKFAEVTLSLIYRRVDASGKVFGGAFNYLEHGLADIGWPKFGRVLAVIFGVMCVAGGLGGGNMFQSNQAISVLVGNFESLRPFAWVLSLLLALLVGYVLMGSIKRVGKVAAIISPLKGLLYLGCAVVILGMNWQALPSAIMLIINEAFTGNAAQGGMIGMLAMAFRRASFANEAGVGSAPIAHAAAKTPEPAQEGAVALLEPLFAAGIGLLTGLIVVVTGAYVGADGSAGVMITSNAFQTVAPWFQYLLVVNVLVFAYSTMVGWSYYGEIAWSYLFGTRSIKLYMALYVLAAFVGGIIDFGVVIKLADFSILGMAIPNVIAMVVLRKRILAELRSYSERLLNKPY